MTLPLLPTSLVGSYAQPDWLIDRARLKSRPVPRTRSPELWRVAPEFLEEAQNDATLLAIRAQEQAGLDIITDGEIRRVSYSSRFANALDGIDASNPAEIMGRSGRMMTVPRVVGPLRRRGPVEVESVKFLRAATERHIKVTLPGPFTMSQQAKDEHYGDEAAFALGFAEAVRAEILDLFEAGADIVQLDEPYMEAAPDKAREFGVAAFERALAGITGTKAVHLCFGYAALVPGRPPAYSFLEELAQTSVDQISIETAQSHLDCAVLERLAPKTIILGVIDLSTETVEEPDAVAARIRRALPYVAPERLVVAPDCGFKYMPRAAAFGKMQAMAAGAAQVRRSL
jgi:5-methyltetrahydropteroyltriglutamate--homocysteine methyltransferase